MTHRDRLPARLGLIVFLPVLAALGTGCGAVPARAPAATAAMPPPAPAAPPVTPVPDSVLPHQTFTIDSRVLGEARLVNVYTPPGYDGAPDARYPVLYMPDGEGPDTFSPFDVVGHLIDGEETDWVPRARIILARGPNPVFEPYDRFRHRARNVGRTLGSLLEEFAQLRGENLLELRSWDLTSAALELPGIHPSLGGVTLRQLLAAWVVHDLGHLAQVGRVMAKQLRDEVGPWEPFLPVLTDHETPRS